MIVYITCIRYTEVVIIYLIITLVIRNTEPARHKASTPPNTALVRDIRNQSISPAISTITVLHPVT